MSDEIIFKCSYVVLDELVKRKSLTFIKRNKRLESSYNLLSEK